LTHDARFRRDGKFLAWSKRWVLGEDGKGKASPPVALIVVVGIELTGVAGIDLTALLAIIAKA